jgi:hypothetical protein
VRWFDVVSLKSKLSCNHSVPLDDDMVKASSYTTSSRMKDKEGDGVAARKAAMEAPYEAWKRGKSHHTDSDFAAIWQGEDAGFSRRYVVEHLSSQRLIIDELQTGRKRPKEILGASIYGSTEVEIIDNLRQGVVLFEEALRCGGRNLSVNQKRVMQRVRSEWR